MKKTILVNLFMLIFVFTIANTKESTFTDDPLFGKVEYVILKKPDGQLSIAIEKASETFTSSMLKDIKKNLLKRHIFLENANFRIMRFSLDIFIIKDPNLKEQTYSVDVDSNYIGGPPNVKVTPENVINPLDTIFAEELFKGLTHFGAVKLKLKIKKQPDMDEFDEILLSKDPNKLITLIPRYEFCGGFFSRLLN